MNNCTDGIFHEDNYNGVIWAQSVHGNATVTINHLTVNVVASPDDIASPSRLESIINKVLGRQAGTIDTRMVGQAQKEIPAVRLEG